MLLAAPLGAQPVAPAGTMSAARMAVAPLPTEANAVITIEPRSCGSSLKNGTMLGLGLALATASLELVYTLLRAPFANAGHDVPRAEPWLIAIAGGAGFLVGVVRTEICRR